jgi:hypothetical protein
VLLTIGASWVVSREAVVFTMYRNQRRAFANVQAKLPGSGTLAVSDSLLLLPLHYYSPKQVSERIVFPLDFNAVRKYKREDSPEQNLWNGRNVFPVPIVSPRTLLQLTGGYYAVTTRGNWLLEMSADEGIRWAELDVDTDSGAIGGFTPLSHAPVHYYLVGGSTEQGAAASKGRQARTVSSANR